MAKARIRGIYSTALTKLLLDEGFEIVQPSAAIIERFKLERNDESPNLDIYDRFDRQGVQAFGEAKLVNMFSSILRSHLDDVVVRKWAVAVDGIYKGLIKEVDPATHSVLVDIGVAVGRMDEREISDSGEGKVVVQIAGRGVGAREPLLTRAIRIPGKYAVLLLERKVKVSRKIRDEQTRFRLQRLGEELLPQNWGILWRTSSADQPIDVLKNEIGELAEKGQAILERAGLVEAPATLWEGRCSLDVEFPALSKRRLDEVRRLFAPTLEGHHCYKASGESISSAVDMAERLLERGYLPNSVRELFEQTVETEYPVEGSWIDIDHVKLSGRVLQLGKAFVETFDRNQSLIRFRRVFEREGIYDGLGTRKEPDDYAVTEAKVGEWHFKTKYFSRDGRYKGMYINLNTPIELYPYGIRYVDLEVDVCVWPEGKAKTLDEEKLEKAAEEGLVTEKLVEIVKEKLQKIVKDVSKSFSPMR